MKKFLILALSMLAAVALLVVSGTAGSRSSPAEAQPTDAVAKVITDPQDLIDGPMSRGRLGDYLLSNSEIQVVIQDVQRNILNIGQFGGQIIDADLVRGVGNPERDSFEEWAFGINIENTGHYTSVSIINDGSDGQPAVIRATGVDDLLDFTNPSSLVAGLGFTLPAPFDDVDLPVEITTDYILAPDDSFVRVDTTVRNIDPIDPVETFISDFLGGSGQVELFQPGYGFGEARATTACALCNFVAWSGEGQADGVSYGYIHDIDNTTTFSDNGVLVPLLGESVLFALTGVAGPNFTIPPEDEITVTRYFAVGDGSVGSIVDIRNQVLGLATGTISGTVTRGGSPVEGADVVVLGDPTDGPGTEKNVVSHYRTDASGNYQGTLPPGDYTLQANLDGHLAATPDPASVTVTDGGATVQDFTIPQAGRVQVTIVDENSASIAGKVSIVGFDPNPDPGNFQNIFGLIQNNTGVFGEVSKDRIPFGLAKVVFIDQSGDSGEFFIEPGDYQVVVSHGTEYSIFKQNITVTAGALTTVNAQIARVIDTSGFASGDFHVHAIASPDSDITNEERAISMLAEGVDFYTPTDHEYRTDLGPVMASLGVGSLISFAVGNENTPSDYGHFNAWPLTIDPTKVNNGALDWAKEAPPGEDFPSLGNFMMPPAEIIASLLADPGVDTVQINHIDSFFGPDGLAVDTGLVPPQHFQDALSRRLDPAMANLFDDGFTALEIWQGTDRSNILGRLIGKNLGDWFNLMNQGIVRTGVADSDTHKTVNNQSGFPRTMVASPTDDPGALGAIAETLSMYVNDGRTAGTNAPFVRVTSEAISTEEAGGLELGLPTLISTTDSNATVTVEIQSPLWAEFDTVEYYVNNVPTPDDFDADPSTPPFYRVTPDVVHTAGVDFTVDTVDDFPLIPGAEHLEATDLLSLTGLTEDTWVVVLVRGTDGASKPIFPVVPNDLDETTNTALADLTDGNLGELGVPATAFTNPLFIDVDGNALYDPPWTAACASGVAIGNGPSIPGDDRTVPGLPSGARVPDVCDSDDDNDGYLDNLELLLPDPSCPAKSALTSPGGDITYDDNNDGNPAAGSIGGTDIYDDPTSWDSDGDSVLDGAECNLGTDPANPASKPTAAQCGGTGDTDGDGLLNAWETCKWGTNPAVIDTDGDTKGDCVEAVDTDGNGIVDFGRDALNSARASLLPAGTGPGKFGKDGDFDLNGNNVIMGDFGADTLTTARMAFKIVSCK